MVKAHFQRSKFLTAVVNGPTVSIGVTTPYRTERELTGERYDNSVSRSCAAQRSRILRGGERYIIIDFLRYLPTYTRSLTVTVSSFFTFNLRVTFIYA